MVVTSASTVPTVVPSVDASDVGAGVGVDVSRGGGGGGGAAWWGGRALRVTGMMMEGRLVLVLELVLVVVLVDGVTADFSGIRRLVSFFGENVLLLCVL